MSGRAGEPARAILLATLVVLFAALVGTAPASGTSGPAPGSPLIYRGGPVMHSSAVHLIYWAPTGHALGAGYAALVDGFFHNLAAGEAPNGSVFASLAQYSDGKGRASGHPTYAGSVFDRQPYPPSKCALPGVPVCLQDSQVQSEIDRVVAAGAHARGLRDLYVLLTPRGVGECGYAGGCTYRGYCAYHSWIGARSSPTLYAVVAYADVPGCRGPSSPNGNPADQAIDDASHEYSEAVDDPLGNAWIDAAGEESADKCLDSFGPASGRSAFGSYDAVIGDGAYELQDEWSNAHGRCVAALAGFAQAPAILHRCSRARFDGSDSAGPGGHVRAYAWRFGDGATATGPRVAHRYARAGRYEVELAVRGGAGAVVTVRRPVSVAPRACCSRTVGARRAPRRSGRRCIGRHRNRRGRGRHSR